MSEEDGGYAAFYNPNTYPPQGTLASVSPESVFTISHYQWSTIMWNQIPVLVLGGVGVVQTHAVHLKVDVKLSFSHKVYS